MPLGDTLAVRAAWVAQSVGEEARELLADQLPIAEGVGLTGVAWARSEPRSQSRAVALASPRGRLLGPTHPWALLAIPARSRDTVLGVFELHAAHQAEAPRELPALNAAGYLLGVLLERWATQQGRSVLTARELEVLMLASQGLTTPKIAVHLTLSPWTVKTHLEHIRHKLKASDRTHAVAIALRAGMMG
jgi:DNA-binding CsgD family transcriptional regulator